MSFESFNLDSRIVSAIQAQGYTQPTPIQAKAIPEVLSGKDILGIAQTGTGKTAAFVLPILERLCKNTSRKVRALIIAPTRELALQIEDVIKSLACDTGIRSTTVFGGVSVNPQINILRQGVDIVVACPGRLLDHIQQGTIDLRNLEVLVLDEADQMFDMGFLPTIKQIVKRLPSERQTLLFSATMPDDIRRLASSILSNPTNVEVGRREPLKTIEHAVYPVTQALKTSLLVEIFSKIELESVIVFTRTKHRAKKLAETLNRKGFKVTSLQGNLSQNRRTEAMEGFRSRKYQVLVATDIAARGIDISNVSHVINYDIPDTVETYTHRIGRTGRAACTGEAFTFITQEDNGMVRDIERAIGSKLERKEVAGFDYNAPAPSGNEFARGPRPQQGSRSRSPQGGNRSSRPQGNRSSQPRSSQGRSYSDQPRSSEGRSEQRSYQPRAQGSQRSYDNSRGPRDSNQGEVDTRNFNRSGAHEQQTNVFAGTGSPSRYSGNRPRGAGSGRSRSGGSNYGGNNRGGFRGDR